MKFKEVKAKRAKVKSRAEVERARQRRKAERKKRRADWLQRRADRREEEKHRRAENGEPQVTKARSKRDPMSHHGTESVDATILKLLGKSHKSRKVVGKGKRVEKKKVETQQGPEGTKWRPGMREEASEGWQEERRLKQQAGAERSTKEKETTDLASKVQSEPKIVEEKQGGEAEVHQIEPMPPCMVFYQVNRKQVTISLTQIHCYYFFSFFTVIEFSPVQVHADHLCTPEAHLGSWPVPPPNSILVPPFFPPCQIAELLDRQKPPADSPASLTSSSGSDERVVLEDIGTDLEADLNWDPYEAACSNWDEVEAQQDTERRDEERESTDPGCLQLHPENQQTLPDFPPPPSLLSDVPPSPTFHPGATTSIPPMPPCMEFYKVRRKQVTVSLTQILVITFSYFSLNFPLFRCTQTTSAPQKLTLAPGHLRLQTPSLFPPSSHPASRQVSSRMFHPLQHSIQK